MNYCNSKNQYSIILSIEMFDQIECMNDRDDHFHSFLN